ncbi:MULTISPECIES: YafY family protein [unclassified Streptomyces]|uniref:helix-turn-helix transcriptional regulator n=1 Tax=unclassified Streptomyces TaxID=2593676 RepID=UPI002E13BC3A|nr:MULTISPECIES: YafY family protein [unclassified Streptomyces]WSJ25973.1 YafY family transcriptional regulator [Streptomyces sp. NBC_01324]
MNRTDRLYALVEELRAVSPRPRSARWLADRFEVSSRTIERDISALLQAGVPVWAEPGRTGGYCLDRSRTLPPVNLTPGEAVAMAVALRGMEGTPFRATAAAALRKLVAAMGEDDAAAAHDMAGRVHLLGPVDAPAPAQGPRGVTDALSTGRVLRIEYGDREGATTTRDIEPLGYIGKTGHWYLLAWCRLRDALRAFRTDRIVSVHVTAEVPEPRELRREDLDIPYGVVHQLSLS